MKKHLPYIFIVLLATSCYSIQEAQGPKIVAEPVGTNPTFWDNGQLFAYQGKDSVIVSLGFNEYYNGEFIMDMTIDNQSSDTIFFNPQLVYVFRYRNDSLLEKKIYYALDPATVVDSINNKYMEQQKRMRRNTGLSIFLFAAYLTAEVVGASGDISWEAMDAIRLTHDLAQIGIDQSRMDAADKMYNLEFAGDYWARGAFQKSSITPKSYESGKIHFKIPYADTYKIYMPLERNLYRFIFKGSQEL